MKKIMLVVLIGFSLAVSAQDFSSYTVSERDTLVKNLPEGGIQLSFNGTATLNKQGSAKSYSLTKKGVVKEKRSSSKERIVFPFMVKGICEGSQYQARYDTAWLFNTVSSITKKDSTLVLWVKFGKFKEYPLPFISNGGQGPAAAGNVYALATSLFPVVDFNGVKYALTGSGFLQFKKIKSGSDDTKTKIVGDAKARN